MFIYRLKKINAIAREGLALLDDNFRVGEDEPDPHGILVRSSRVNTDDFANLLAVARAGAGVNNISVDRATERGICVFNTPGANANAVVDLVFPMIGVWQRNIWQGIQFCQSLSETAGDQVDGEVERQKSAFRGNEIAGKTLAVIGLGQIGVRLANGGIHRAMKVIGFDPNPVMGNIHMLLPEVELASSLSEAIGHADIVSLHVPLIEKTRNLVNREFIVRMKKGALLVNYARGPIVDEQAVLNSLADGHLSGFISDFPSSALIGHEKVLLTPHLGASTSESEENCAVMAVRELTRYLRYGNITNSVNFPNIETVPSDFVRTRMIVINKDVPGMIAFITNVLGSEHINIASLKNESNGVIGYNIIDMESKVSEHIAQRVLENENVIRTRLISFSP
ncbi:MAG TPA: 3-phosphoglycerate dehydrogenase [Desulfofustis sp.]|jgi:D-3-phosphoglycerate dehydrogenase|nr:3-phosphoglycerate dehydrogenase [Desulfofustis sp. PB-SRB1]HBH29284.1 3-phosphoglycerate dehydrogenase [Desulfofustis sp.]